MATRTVPGAAPSQAKKGKPSGSTGALNGKSVASKEAAPAVASGPIDYSIGGKPNKEAYDREQNEIKKEIERLQNKSNEIRAQIGSSSGKNADAERRAQLRSELDAVKGEQAANKGGRQKIVDQIKNLQEVNRKRIQDLTAARSKAPFKTMLEVDNQIKSLEKRVESATMKLVEEKRTLTEISSLKRSRKVVEGFATQQQQIDATKKEIEALQASANDPAIKSSFDKMQSLRAELDEISKRSETKQKEKNALFKERNALQKQIDELYTKKKESVANFRSANDKYFQKMQEDRNRRMEKQKAEKAQFEDQKKKELHAQWREEAAFAAFADEIQDCNNLIFYFNKLRGINTPLPNGASATATANALGLPSLNLREVDGALPEGAKALKKKGTEDEGSWGGLGKKGKKGKKVEKEEEEGEKKESDKLNVPFQTLSALLKLGIEAPLIYGDLERTVGDLEKKKLYFETNQERVTKEKVAAVEAKIAAQSKANGSSSPATGDSTSQPADTPQTDATADAIAETAPEAVEDAEEKEQEKNED
ncbi:hypothetical protein BT69DRAFT_1221754 [Atractiella rhizophila]|nr:hypothetical protein BT69DRAFT_1221754 [Atractiella rhizophila]